MTKEEGKPDLDKDKKDAEAKDRRLAILVPAMTAIITGGLTAWATVASTRAKAELAAESADVSASRASSASAAASQSASSAEASRQQIDPTVQAVKDLRSLASGLGQTPLGSVVAWWGITTDGKSDLPAGYELCDGTAVTTQDSPLLHVTKPDLRGVFIKGASAPGDVRSKPVTGGNSKASGLRTLDHTLTIAQIPAHNHEGTTTGNAKHNHDTAGPAADDDGGITGDTHFALGDSKDERRWVPIRVSGGDHQHSIPTQGGSGGHSHPLPDIPTEPPFLTMHYLIRVK